MKVKKYNKVMRFSLDEQIQSLDSRLSKISRKSFKDALKKYSELKSINFNRNSRIVKFDIKNESDQRKGNEEAEVKV